MQLIPIKDGEELGNRPPVVSNSLSIIHMSLPGVWIAPEIEEAIEEPSGSPDEYAEKYRAVLLQRREMLISANQLFNHKFKFSVEDPILPIEDLIDLMRTVALRYDLRTRDKNWLKVVEMFLDDFSTPWQHPKPPGLRMTKIKWSRGICTQLDLR